METKLTALYALILISILPLAFSANDAVVDFRGRPIRSTQFLSFFPVNPTQSPQRHPLTLSSRNSSDTASCIFNLAQAQGSDLGTPFFFAPRGGSGSDDVVRVSSPLSIFIDRRSVAPEFCWRDPLWAIQPTTVNENSYNLVVVDHSIRPVPGIILDTYFRVQRIEGLITSHLYKIEYVIEYYTLNEPSIQTSNVGLQMVGDRALLMTTVEPTAFEFVPYHPLMMPTESRAE